VKPLPTGLQVVAQALPLTYAIEALQVALTGGPPGHIAPDLAALAAFAVVPFLLAVRILGRRWV